MKKGTRGIKGAAGGPERITLIILITIMVILVMLALLNTRGAKITPQSIKTPPKKLKKQETTQTVYVYPSGDKGTLRYDWKTGEKGIEINFE